MLENSYVISIIQVCSREFLNIYPSQYVEYKQNCLWRCFYILENSLPFSTYSIQLPQLGTKELSFIPVQKCCLFCPRVLFRFRNFAFFVLANSHQRKLNCIRLLSSTCFPLYVSQIYLDSQFLKKLHTFKRCSVKSALKPFLLEFLSVKIIGIYSCET